jgi:hypothetical protein
MSNGTLPAASPFARKLASIAQGQFDQFHTIDENDPPLSTQIKKYWTTLGFDFPGVEVPWSAVFVSFCVKMAGATKEEFEFAAAHSVFVHKAIKNATNDTGVFRGFRINERAVGVGDIIQNNRLGANFDFDFAKSNPNYQSHTAIVVLRGEDSQGKFAMTIGGNESDSVRMKRVNLKPDGTVKQRTSNPFICIVKNLK